MNGKKVDVIIEDILFTDQNTGLTATRSHEFVIWANDGKKQIIEAVEGVSVTVQSTKTMYLIVIDPRYDVEYVKQQIIADILCKGK